MRYLPIAAALAALAFSTSTALATEPDGLLMVRNIEAAPTAVVASIKDYVAAKEWRLLAEVELKNGKITALQICPGDAKHASAAELPPMILCSQLSIFEENGLTQVAMLHPAVMSEVSPLPDALSELSASFAMMLDAVPSEAPSAGQPWLHCGVAGCP